MSGGVEKASLRTCLLSKREAGEGEDPRGAERGGGRGHVGSSVSGEAVLGKVRSACERALWHIVSPAYEYIIDIRC